MSSHFQIREVENLSHLTHLRVLNLAGNELTCVTGLTGLTALAELNFRRNRITHVASRLCMVIHAKMQNYKFAV